MDISAYNIFDSPVPYRNIKIYPVTVKDYMFFNVYSNSLYLDKNSIPDPKIISMTELGYLYYITEIDPEHPYLIWFDRLLALCIKEDESFMDIQESIKRYKYDEKGKPYFVIGEEKYFEKDFEEIRDIIATQNLIEKPDYTISKEVRDSLNEAREYKNRLSGMKSGSIEDYIISISVVTGWTFDYIQSMTIRKFTKSIRRLDNFIHYKIYLAASMSGMVKFDDKSFIKHWLSDIESDDKYSDVSMDLNTVQNKVSLESAK